MYARDRGFARSRAIVLAVSAFISAESDPPRVCRCAIALQPLALKDSYTEEHKLRASGVCLFLVQGISRSKRRQLRTHKTANKVPMESAMAPSPGDSWTGGLDRGLTTGSPSPVPLPALVLVQSSPMPVADVSTCVRSAAPRSFQGDVIAIRRDE